MRVEQIFTGIATVVVVVGAVREGIKHWRERDLQTVGYREMAIKAVAERDSVVVKSAEGSLLMMQGLLQIAKATETDLRKEMVDMRAAHERQMAEMRAYYEAQTAELRDELRRVRARLKDVEDESVDMHKRLAAYERGERGTATNP